MAATASALLVATETRWPGTARMPRALAKAGFAVSLLTPRDSLAEKSRYVAKIGYLPADASAMQWVHAFAATVVAIAPRLVVPCDDRALGLLQMLALAPPAPMQPELHLRLATLIRESVGDPSHWRTCTDRTLFPPFAAALGLDVPAYAVSAGVDEIAAFGQAHGWPVVVKRSHGAAGMGVAICADRDEVVRALPSLAAADPREATGPNEGPPRFLVQEYLSGRTQYFEGAAWNGRLLAGHASEHLAADPEPTGAPTVTRHFRSTPLRAAAAKLVAGLGIAGLFGVEFRTDARTDAFRVIAVHRHVSPATHLGAALDVDPCAALHAALEGTAPTSRTDLAEGEQRVAVHFPGEWLRDPESAYLRDYPVDVPWDEPELIDALLALEHERRVSAGDRTA